jgi:hypothetical protein
VLVRLFVCSFVRLFVCSFVRLFVCSYQLRECLATIRQCNVFDSIVLLEFNILNHLLHRQQQPRYCVLMIIVLCKCSSGVRTYIRALETGSGCGFVERFVQGMGCINTPIIDYQCTEDVVSALKCNLKTRANDIETCLSSWDSMIKQCKEHTKLAISSMIGIRTEDSSFLKNYKLSIPLITSTLETVSTNPLRFNLCLDRFISTYNNNTEYNDEQSQLNILNCITPKFVHYPYVNGPQSWTALSLKHAVIDDCIESTYALQQSKNSCKRITQGFKRSIKTQHTTNADVTNNRDDDPIFLFKQQLMSNGFMRVIEATTYETVIVWNGYDCATGENASCHL